VILMITIVGAGKVGSSAAFEILKYQIGDVVLVDLNADLARGEALDMMQAAPAIEFDGNIRGTSDFEEMEGSELVIIIAGQGRKPGMTRMELIVNNSKIITSTVKEVAKYAPDSKLMIVTNPVDIMTFIARKESGFPPNHVFRHGKHTRHTSFPILHRPRTQRLKRRHKRPSDR